MISLLLGSVTLSSSRTSCLAFIPTENTCQQRGRRESFRKGTACFASTIEKSSTAEPVNQTEYENESFSSLLMNQSSDYEGNLINVTNVPYFVNPSHSQSFTKSRPESIVHEDDVDTRGNGEKKKTVEKRSIWRRRNARSAQEGIRREKLPQLSSLLERAGAMETYTQLSPKRHYAARTISGLIHGLAEEAIDLEVQVDARSDTPLWEKQVDAVEIKFSRLSFKPLRIGGVNEHAGFDNEPVDDAVVGRNGKEEFNMPFLDLSSADEAFRRIDSDNSGALDREEIIRALNLAAGCLEEEEQTPRSKVIQNIANELFTLYDFNGDGVVDRNEYQSLVEDMAALSSTQGETRRFEPAGWFSALYTGTKNYISGIFRSEKGEKLDSNPTPNRPKSIAADAPPANPSAERPDTHDDDQEKRTFFASDPTIVDVSDSAEEVGKMAKSLGSITFSGLKLDLRRLAFGGVPVIKRITPGGPLILEPFTMTIAGSFSASDIMNSSLIDAGLRLLVGLVLRRRMRSFRDLLDLAVLRGRDWTMASAMAPVTQVTELSSVEFDDNNKMIITGRAKVRTRPGAPTIEQAFKVRVNAGTRKNGRFIRLVEPELAFVLECPKPMEEGIGLLFESMNLKRPPRPKPLYSFFPIYSPFKVDDNDGFDLGDDNRIKKLYIEDGALKFEVQATIRPGRFLGNHYIAFSIPNRTFIVTMDRVKEGIRSARQAKAAMKAAKASLPKEVKQAEKRKKVASKRKQPKSFFSRFVSGYLQVEREDGSNPSAPVTTAIRDFFGKQGAFERTLKKKRR